MRTIAIGRRTAIAAAAASTVFARAGRAATVLRWATVLPANHPEVTMIEHIGAQVREATGDAVEIQVFPGGQLGSSRDSIESASSGAIQMVIEGAAQFGQFVPQISILEGPYLWRDPAHMRRVLSSPVLDEMSEQLVAKRQMRILGATYYGTRQLSSGNRPIHTVDDMKGFKIRIPEVDTFRAMAEAWGARPTPLNIGELYLALSQGAVDGQENPLPTMQSTRLNEVQKFLVLTAHVMTPRPIVINETAWQGLSVPQQDALKAAIAKHAPIQDAEIIAQETALREGFAKSGMTVIEPDVDSFRKPVLATLPAKFEAKWGKGLWDRLANA
jgi:tripartite ATP-independent transporter DctP family solute receptor